MTPRGARTKRGTPTDALQHWRKADRFSQAARHDWEGEYWEACCSNAVLSAVHAASAISLYYRGIRSASQNHDEALNLVEQIQEMDPESRQRFVRHLDALLDVKTLVQYSSREYGKKDAMDALQHLDRALDSLREVSKNAGWI